MWAEPDAEQVIWPALVLVQFGAGAALPSLLVQVTLPSLPALQAVMPAGIGPDPLPMAPPVVIWPAEPAWT